MKAATRKPPVARPRPRAAVTQVVQNPPPPAAGVDEFAGQGQRLFQLLRVPLMRAFANTRKDTSHG